LKSTDKKHEITTKQYFQKVEQMTPIKKLLHHQEQQKQMDVNSREQITQLYVHFQIPKV
jgi:hypothetical protein